ncbi:MAG: hypothetical protein JWQ27_1119 [Ferruginibacter sp.]|nr:hypothetical protein [Ferruginibacter sp.]
MLSIKFFILSSLLIAFGCKPSVYKTQSIEPTKLGQNVNSNSKSGLQLNEPRPGKSVPIDTSLVNCYIDLTGKIYKIRILNRFDTASESTLSKYVSTHKVEMAKQKVFIIISDKVKPSTAIDILDMFVINDIPSYDIIEDGKIHLN